MDGIDGMEDTRGMELIDGIDEMGSVYLKKFV